MEFVIRKGKNATQLIFTILAIALSSSTFAEVKGNDLYDLTYYYGPGGTFVDMGSKRWVENNQDGTFYFDEVTRDEWSVYIKRGTMQLKLDMWTKTIDIKNSNGGYTTLYAIKEANAINNNTSSNGIVTLYQHSNYGGYSVKLPVGNFKLVDLVRRGMKNDDISSLKVPSGYRVKIYENDNFDDHQVIFFGIVLSGGWSETYTSNSSYLNHYNDAISSVRVEQITNEDTSWWLDCDGFYGYFELLASNYAISDECD